jgi:hypothetical protein
VKFLQLTARRIIIYVGVTIIAVAQTGSSAYQRYLHCQSMADTFEVTEAAFRQKASVCEELAPNLREVASLARELAKSASSNFERSKWLEMAHTEEEKATKLEHEAVRLMSQADLCASRANALTRLAWRPWLPQPE